MGRRSINTTKIGKYMNPTDQARKEARKRELKKNKKQRQMVRAAVLKGKDPLQLISDMEKIDEMEFNVNSPPLLNEKVLKDKRKKLKETWGRVMSLYFKEDPERYKELKKLELEYEARRLILVKYFESVRIAQQVQVHEIPLPDTPEMPLFLTSQIPLPREIEGIPNIEAIMLPHSILKKTQRFNTMQPEPITKNSRAPGVPPGPIPDLSSDDEDATIEQEREKTALLQAKLSKARKIRFADEKDENNTEEEKNGEKATDSEPMDVTDVILPNTETEKQRLEDIPIPPLPSAGFPPGLPQGPPPNVQVMFRPPPLRTAIPPPRMLPPGVPPPPPGRPSLPPPGIPMSLGAPIRLPPGPPPRLIRPPNAPPPRLATVSSVSTITPPGTTVASSQVSAGAGKMTVLSAPPSLMQRPKIITPEGAQRSATIEAKAQVRNLRAEVMRFLPTTLRIKRQDRYKKGGPKTSTAYDHAKDNYPASAPVSYPSVEQPTKDDAYQQFLTEMEEIL